MHTKATYSMEFVYRGEGSKESPGKGHFSRGAVGVLFLCSVVVGSVPAIQGEKDMKDPGDHEAGCITARGSEGMLVVFKDFQAVPEYLLSMGKSTQERTA